LARQNNIIWINLFILSEVFEFVLTLSAHISFNSVYEKIKSIILKYTNIIVIDFIFIAFLYYNNFSVVLGDKSHHVLCFHLAQINHFLFFLLIFFPMVNFKIFRLLNKEFYNTNNILKLIFLFIICFLLINFFNQFSYTHDFILSDNRHYSFYYFKKIYNVWSIKTAMTVWTSLIISLIFLDNPNIFRDTLFISFAICTMLILVPAKLFEFRYFSLCYTVFLIILHYDYAKWKDLYYFIFNKYNLIWSIAVNAVTLFIFIEMPFDNQFFSNEESRFMW
jgi:alpha-1,2-glucosyltransferase